MTRSEVQVPHRPPKQKAPIAVLFALVDEDLNLRPREGGGETCKSACRKEMSQISYAYLPDFRGRGTWPSPSSPVR